MTPLLPVGDAVARIIDGVEPLGTEAVGIADAFGRVLAGPLAATRTHPPFPASSMDGYAVRAGDLTAIPATLKLIGVSAAGHGFAGTVGPGEAVRISTGAPVPPGADAILIQENAERPDPATVVAGEGVEAGKHIRPAGQDFGEGAVLLEAGRRFGMREVALAAAMGHADVPARRRPRIAVLSTGDELVPPGARPGPDQIVASSAIGIVAYAGTLGADATDLGIVRDDTRATAEAIDAALSMPADILVTIGGASVGDHDLVQDALTDRGMNLAFWRIAMRPGKPLMFGAIERPEGGPAMRVLGLPGNPVSSLVCTLLFLTPLIDALLGRPPRDMSEPAVLGRDVGENDARQDYVRSVLVDTPGGGPPTATPLPVQDSGMLATLATADCLLIRAPHAPPAAAGSPCRIIRLP